MMAPTKVGDGTRKLNHCRPNGDIKVCVGLWVPGAYWLALLSFLHRLRLVAWTHRSWSWEEGKDEHPSGYRACARCIHCVMRRGAEGK